MGLSAKQCRQRNLAGGPPPCVKCGTSDGYTIEGTGRPARFTAFRHGYFGMVCHECHHDLRREPATVVPPPCDLCGCDDPANHRRFPGKPYDLEGLICSGCRYEIQAEREADTKVTRVIERANDGGDARAVILKIERDAESRYRRMISRRARIVGVVKIAEMSGMSIREAWKFSRAKEVRA